MTNWDLATRENWELILSDQRTVVYKEGTQPTAMSYKYTPISPIYASPQSHVLLIGTYSNSARAHWFLGARASQYLYVSPSMNSSFLTSGVQASDTKKIGLNRLTLVEFKDYNVVPYILQLDIPYWLEDIYVEVWEYQGITDDYHHSYEEIINRLESIENQLVDGNTNQGWGNY